MFLRLDRFSNTASQPTVVARVAFGVVVARVAFGAVIACVAFGVAFVAVITGVAFVAVITGVAFVAAVVGVVTIIFCKVSLIALTAKSLEAILFFMICIVSFS